MSANPSTPAVRPGPLRRRMNSQASGASVASAVIAWPYATSR
ncbi:hypothetical protein ACWV27_27045 (plasmid) [Massilia varians]